VFYITGTYPFGSKLFLLISRATVFSTIVAITRGMVPDAHRVFDPEMLLREVVRHTHYLPSDWEGQLHSKMVRT
jgi:hypothetical protein